MSQWLKLAECQYSPAPVYAIFDYSKIVYPIDNTLCLREIVTIEQKSTFIELGHKFDQMLAIFGANNRIVTVEKHEGSWFVGCYGAGVDQTRNRIFINLEGKEIKLRTLFNENNLALVFSQEKECANQIVFFDCIGKSIIARGLVEADIKQVSLGPNSSVSLLTQKSVVAFKNEQTTDPTILGRVYKQVEFDLPVDAQHHSWIEDELLVWGSNKVYLLVKGKICQQFDSFHRLHNIVVLNCGFLACDGCVLKVYKKKSLKYEPVCDIIDENLMEAQQIKLSPQQDILAYFSPLDKAIIYSTTFGEQLEQLEKNAQSQKGAATLKTNKIAHSKSFDFSVYSSKQPWFATVNSSKIKLVNSNNYNQFLNIELEDSDPCSFSSSQAKIRYLTIHPNRPLLAVALRKMIRLYYVTFNEIRVLKELNFSMCGLLLFNNSGSVLAAVVSGKGGAKIYLFKANQIRCDFSLIQTITISKKPLSLAWDSLDSRLYCFFTDGYYEWSSQSKFKNRRQFTPDLKMQIKGAIVGKEDSLVFWSSNRVVRVEGSEVMAELAVKGMGFKQVIKDDEYYYFVMADGRIIKNRNLEIDQGSAKAFNLRSNGENFQLQLQDNGKFIYVSKDLNLKFYEQTSTNSLYTDVVGIDKKKLYTMLRKHTQYERQVKKMREQLNEVVNGIKLRAEQQQRLKQEQYRSELWDHIEREKKVKEEKIKLEEIMEYNIDIKQRQAMDQVKQLERLYERKIALTTNKLLTEKEIGFRDKVTSENKLKQLEQKHDDSVEEIRKQFAEHVRKNLLDKAQAQKQINDLKKNYETKLYQLEEQNELLLKELQEKNEAATTNLRTMLNTWENKFSECMSKKNNIEKQLSDQNLACEILKQKMRYLESKKAETEVRCEHLSHEIAKIEGVLEERNTKILYYEKRIEDLEKSNEILKYRVLELKEQNDPHEDEVSKLKLNLTELEEEYDKVVKQAYEEEQKNVVVKKEKNKLKEQLEHLTQKQKKLNKKYEELIDKLRETTKSPIQEIRRELLALVESYSRMQKSQSVTHNRADSPLGELNRIRDHLEICLDQAVNSSKKNEEQRKNDIMKKSHENSELIIEINTMRKRIRQLEDEVKQRDLKISRILRGEYSQSVANATSSKDDKVDTTEAQTKQFTKTRSKETFFENSMFKSNTLYNQKRLKTEEGPSRRKKSSYSMARDRNHHGSLAIQPQAEEIEEYKRIIEQKDIFIKKLIAKIQKH